MIPRDISASSLAGSGRAPLRLAVGVVQLEVRVRVAAGRLVAGDAIQGVGVVADGLRRADGTGAALRAVSVVGLVRAPVDEAFRAVMRHVRFLHAGIREEERDPCAGNTISAWRAGVPPVRRAG